MELQIQPLQTPRVGLLPKQIPVPPSSLGWSYCALKSLAACSGRFDRCRKGDLGAGDRTTDEQGQCLGHPGGKTRSQFVPFQQFLSCTPRRSQTCPNSIFLCISCCWLLSRAGQTRQSPSHGQYFHGTVSFVVKKRPPFSAPSIFGQGI